MKKGSRCLLFLLLGFPCSAWANAGTPLVWGTLLHLSVGNLLLGIGEGMLLAWLFKTPKRRSIFSMIAANYFSAIAGCVILGLIATEFRTGVDLHNYRRYLAGMAVGAYLLTILLEYGFVLLACGWKAGKMLPAFKVSAVIQTISYSVIFGWYLLCGQNSLIWNVEVADQKQIAVPANLAIYYIAEKDGNVYCWRGRTGTARKVFDLHAVNEADSLAAIHTKRENPKPDLAVLRFPEHSVDTDEFQVLLPQFASFERVVAEEAAPYEDKKLQGAKRYQSRRWGKAQKLGHPQNPSVEYRTFFWAWFGLMKHDLSSHQSRLLFGLETPFLHWPICNVIVLPTDKLLLQLGARQICIFDPATMKIALIAHGRGALPVLEETGRMP